MIAKGSSVRQKVPTIEGVIDDAKLDADTGVINYHVSFKGADGEPSARWFAEDDLEVLDNGRVKETITSSDVGDLNKVLGSRA